PVNGAGGGTRTLTGLPPTDFHTSYGFRRRRTGVCGLDYTFTVAERSALGAARLVSTPSLSGLARDCHLTGFPEFEQFCVPGFPGRTQMIFKSVASTVPPRPRGPKSGRPLRGRGSSSSPSPRLQGEGQGDGAFLRAQTRGQPLTPITARSDLSPQAGRKQERRILCPPKSLLRMPPDR